MKEQITDQKSEQIFTAQKAVLFRPGIILAAAVLLLLMLFRPVRVWAAGKVSLSDEADLLNSSEESEIRQTAQAMADEWGYDFLILTTDDAGGESSGTLAEDYFIENASQDDGIVYIIDMDNREINVRTSGIMIDVLSDERIDSMLDDGYEYVSEGEYTDTFLVMLEDTQNYLERDLSGKSGSGSGVSMAQKGWIAGIIGLLAGIIFFVSVTLRYGMKTGTYSYNYRDNGTLDLKVRDDRLVNRFVTRRHIQREPPDGGGHGGGGHPGGSTHVGSGGHTFGGGDGRKF